jgi:acyl-CoA reductase-like NAD-dependent aldehyde dehydrogenase
MAETRLDVLKTYKLFVDGKFPRSESGRTTLLKDGNGRPLAHICKASRKDLRDAVGAARKAQPGWAGATAYLRGQVLYRMAEMVQGKSDELAGALRAGGQPAAAAKREVLETVDRLVAYAGWADKYAQVLGCNNAVAGPYYNFTVPEPTGVVAVVCPDEPGLLGLVSLLAPVVCPGNSAVVVAGGSTGAALAAVVLAEAWATSDLPGGVVNILTGDRAELVPVIAGHRDIDAVHTAGIPADQAAALQRGAAENVKRVIVRGGEPPAKGAAKGRASGLKGQGGVDFFDRRACESPWWIEGLVEMKTIWHPASV